MFLSKSTLIANKTKKMIEIYIFIVKIFENDKKHFKELKYLF
jgi:hypothetical protein